MPDKFGNPTPEEVAAAQAVLDAAANPVPEPAPEPAPVQAQVPLSVTVTLPDGSVHTLVEQ